jgi:cytochrome P450
VTDVAPVFFNPLDPEYVANPYPFLEQLREAEPIHQSPLGLWMLFEYRDVFDLLRNPNTSVADDNIEGSLNDMREEMFADLLEEFGGDERDRGNSAILNLDPPDHTRIRKLVSKAFTVRRVEALRPRIQELVDDVLDRVAGTGTWDVVDELAFPLPFQVISELLGMPEGDRTAIRTWSHAITKTLDPIISEEDMRAAF